MSIIHDALKKVQETNAKPLEPTSPTSQPRASKDDHVVHAATAMNDSEPNRLLIFSLMGLLSLIVLAILIILFILARETTREPSTVKAVHTASPKVEPEPRTSSYSTDPLDEIKLQGIMVKKGKPVALINDGVYEVGQKVFGKKIVEIKEDRVIILESGKHRTFKVDSRRK